MSSERTEAAPVSDVDRMTYRELAAEKKRLKLELWREGAAKRTLAAAVAGREAALREQAYSDKANTNDKLLDSAFKKLRDGDAHLLRLQHSQSACDFRCVELDAQISLVRDLQKMRLLEYETEQRALQADHQMRRHMHAADYLANKIRGAV